MGFVKHVLKEPEVRTPEQYKYRVHALAVIHVVLFIVSGFGLLIIIRWGKLFVTLTQRSNVETLTIAFFLIYFLYLVLTSAKGAWGALRLLQFKVVALVQNSTIAEQRKHLALERSSSDEDPLVAVNRLVELEGRPCEKFQIPIKDEIGSIGAIEVDGVSIRHGESFHDGSSNILAFFVYHVRDVLAARGISTDLDIVEWRKIDDEATEKYVSLVDFSRNLSRHLGVADLWPKVTLTLADCLELERRLSEACRALRNEAFLPHSEYGADHKLPIIPEPLGIVSLSRSEKRVDAFSSMTVLLLVVLLSVGLLVLFVRYPPWVPGT